MKNINYTQRPPEIINKPPKHTLPDKLGLPRAYKTPSELYQRGNKLYIAGTRDSRDVIDDLKLPF